MLAVGENGGRARKLPGLEAERIVGVLRSLALRIELLSRISLANAPALLNAHADGSAAAGTPLPGLPPQVAAAVTAHHAAERNLLNVQEAADSNSDAQAEAVAAVQATAREALRMVTRDAVAQAVVMASSPHVSPGCEALLTQVHDLRALLFDKLLVSVEEQRAQQERIQTLVTRESKNAKEVRRTGT